MTRREWEAWLRVWRQHASPTEVWLRGVRFSDGGRA